jgi:hypothetical protein
VGNLLAWGRRPAVDERPAAHAPAA